MAGSIAVTSDSIMGTATISGTNQSNSDEAGVVTSAGTSIFEINGVNTLYNVSITQNISGFTAGNGVDTITSGTGTETITYQGNTVVINFDITGGTATSSGLLTVSGIVTGLTGSTIGNYDFSDMVNSTISDTTRTNVDLTGVLGVSNASASGLFSANQTAVPQPESIVMMAVGIAGAGILVFAQSRRRRAATA